jgi:hypothetical protein
VAVLILIIIGPWTLNSNSEGKASLPIEESSVGYYQTNTCEFSGGQILQTNLLNNKVQFLPDLNSKIKCHGRINGVDYSPDKIKVYIGTNINLDLLIQSLTWMLFLAIIPKTKKRSFGFSRKIIPLSMLVLIYIHLRGEYLYYQIFAKKLDLSLDINNFFLLSIIASSFLILLIFQDLIEDRFYNLINYFPFVFLFIGAYNSYNLNFFLLMLSAIGIIAIIEKKISLKGTTIYLMISLGVLLNFQDSNKLFDVDKLKGFANSTVAIESIIFWLIAFYLVTVGVVFIINESLHSLNLKLIRFNFLLTGGIVFTLGIFSAISPFFNFITYYYLGLNKLGMNALESVKGNTWRGIGASAEGLGEFYAFCIIFAFVISYFYDYKFTNNEYLLLVINTVALFRTNNAAAILAGFFILFLYLIDRNFVKTKHKLLVIFLVISIVSVSYVQLTNFNYDYASRSMLYEGMAIARIDSNLTPNEIGKTAVENSNFGEILLTDTSNISSSLLLLTKFYTETGDIKYLPNGVAIISAISVPINRSQKWGVFFGKYDPTLAEFLFGYGPQQINRYYLGFDTKINTGLVLPHSSILSYLVFFGIVGIFGLLGYILYLMYKSRENRTYNLIVIFFLLNLLKSDSLLYLQNYILVVFIVNFYKFFNYVEVRDEV